MQALSPGCARELPGSMLRSRGCDRRLPRDHAAHIPDLNPGIVVVTNYPDKVQTMTTRIALRVLANLKRVFPAWHQCPLENSILEVTSEGVAVGHVQRGTFANDGYCEFADEAWPAPLRLALEQNTQRSPSKLPGP